MKKNIKGFAKVAVITVSDKGSGVKGRQERKIYNGFFQ